jgi:hypothetical protein
LEKLRELAKTPEPLLILGAPGWDRTSNPCLRRAVLYPLSYGRIRATGPLSTKSAKRETVGAEPIESERIPVFSRFVY